LLLDPVFLDRKVAIEHRAAANAFETKESTTMATTSKGGGTGASTTAGLSINRLPPEQARGHMQMLLLANPNYFGNLAQSGLKPVLNIAGDTEYEELDCVGFSLSLSRLEAVVSIKQVSGYDGAICTAGSQEYIRFYLSFDGGATWLDQGVAGFTVHDIPGPKPLEYSVALPVTLPAEFCFVESLPEVRGILSWNAIPPANTPGFVPVWGNVVDVTVQSPASDFIIFSKLLEVAKLKLPANVEQTVDLNQNIALATKKSLTTSELTALYQGKPVSAARYLYPQINKLAASQAAGSALAANIGDVIGEILATSGNTTYEELDCVGLDLNRGALVGVVRVKLPYGFNGGLCTAGSTEYVAFWVDWGGGLQYEGTATINTHDIAGLPVDGLEYAIALPIDLSGHLKPCTEGAQTVEVRAILSWQTAPPPSNPSYVPVWGNRVNARVQIPAGEAQALPDIAIIGGIGVAQIATSGSGFEAGLTLPGALFALQGSPADPYDPSRQCAFGGEIVVQGAPYVGLQYRVMIQDLTTGSPAASPLTTPFTATDLFGDSFPQSPDASGYFNYLPNTQNIDDILAIWYPTGNDLYQIWLETLDPATGAMTVGAVRQVQLCNQAPTAAIHIDSGGDCKQFDQGSGPIDGHFVATEAGLGTSAQIGHYALGTLPSGNLPSPASGTSDTGPAPGQAWALSLAGMAPCGYVVQLDVWDNTIVDSEPNVWNGNSAAVGFCIV
jgi:hypothetical protein